MNTKRLQKLVQQLAALDEIKAEPFYDENESTTVELTCPLLYDGEENEIYPASRELCYRLANAINAAVQQIIEVEGTVIKDAIREEMEE